MQEEKELEKSIENNEWKRVKNFEVMKSQLKKAASETYVKNQRMNIRIAKKDLDGLKTRALEEGLPYQTLVSSVLHKYVSGRLTEKV